MAGAVGRFATKQSMTVYVMNDRLLIPQNENGRDSNGFGEMI
jgi:hypothetical protein